MYGSPEENPEFWNSVSSNSYLTDLSGPIQLHHGTADTSVPYLLSELLLQQITNVNGEVELYKYEGDNHNISNYFGLAMSRTIEFYDRYLK
jgi:dipeptidyl aminopeptidase/acylaminoacyl peptidase